MKNLKNYLFLIALTFPLLSHGKIIRYNDYDFPEISGLDATLGTVSVGRFGQAAREENITVNYYNGRNRQGTGLSKKKARLRFRVFFPKKPSNQLVFVQAGIGGSHDSQRANIFASALAEAGVYAVSVPSTFYAPFAIYGSRYGYVGDMRLDARDMYTVMQFGLKKIKSKFGIKPNRISVIGYSLSGMTTGFLGEIDYRMRNGTAKQRKNALNFRKVLLIDPVVDMNHAIKLVDTWWSYRSEIFITSKISAFLNLSPQITSFQNRYPTIESFMEFQEIVQSLPDKHKKFAIGRSLHTPLVPIVKYAVAWRRRVKNKDPEKFKPLNLIDLVSSGHPSDISLEQYIRNYTVNLSNLYGRPMTYEKLARQSSLYSIENYLRSNPRVYLLHNADDMWLRGNRDVQRLNKIFGARATIYPRGGHLGNFWYPENWQKTLEILVE